MMYIMSMSTWLNVELNFYHKLSINWVLSMVFCEFKLLIQ